MLMYNFNLPHAPRRWHSRYISSRIALCRRILSTTCAAMSLSKAYHIVCMFGVTLESVIGVKCETYFGHGLTLVVLQETHH